MGTRRTQTGRSAVGGFSPQTEWNPNTGQRVARGTWNPLQRQRMAVRGRFLTRAGAGCTTIVNRWKAHDGESRAGRMLGFSGQNAILEGAMGAAGGQGQSADVGAVSSR